ncbi:Swarming motility regulation sensor protein RssA [Paraburkholderia graminis C4D1M]|uniref:histidine kinase n=1 Tax=Paraburkholderia graminis (strain ATCC 700544 / DSM 17151 / LMG 18924 / NCIMB 13744 / C4D1M) TaxID=396598 RepID=B1G436_PARG4|nr:ATP-binding protein [Paraburkholderia graminis]EDT09109.1 integral membrane sensor signal transduction histidine kinase [Paraburkholderia graminis C4D1M]CAB3734252.1 Swarming motility regulation sensor protein RssA [Paraburkholderia graminis C4D1M]
MTTSIRQRLTLLVLVSVALVWALALISSYRQAIHEAGEWDDARIEQAARTLALIDVHDLVALVNESSHVSDDDGDDDVSRRLLYEVRDLNGQLLAASPGLPGLPRFPPTAAPSAPGKDAANSATAGVPEWNIHQFRDALHDRSVRVFERNDSRADLGAGVARRIARPLAFALPVLALVIWAAIGSSLAPLKILSRAIAARNVDNLETIDLQGTPAEVSPLVDALNVLLSRLRASLDRERAFTADAAHELKSPLAAIKVQAQVALTTRDPAKQRLAMQRVVEAVDRSTHLAEQLLLLARLDERIPAAAVDVQLDTVARECIAAREADALSKGLELSVVGDAYVTIEAPPAFVRIMLDNLVDNAIKYAEAGGRVEIVTRQTPEATLLLVRDNGRGVTEQDRMRLSDRFFRAADARQSGTGLGLSIVARIVDRLGGKLTYTTGIDGRGLGVEIRLPPTSRHNLP